MKVTLKLFATLGDLLPQGAKANAIEIEVPDGSTPNDLIDRFQVPRELAHLLLVNGVYVDRANRDKPIVHSGDTVAVWPPVAGG